MVVLIQPPVVKPCEPPAGISRLSAALMRQGVECVAVDANLEGLLSLLDARQDAGDQWTKRANRHLSANVSTIKNWAVYTQNMDRYKRAVMDVNRVLDTAYPSSEIRISLSNYQHSELSPVRSSDLLTASERPEQNPFYPYFKNRLRELVYSKQPTHMGFSLNFLNQALCTFAMMGFLRIEFPDLPLILGGGLVTSWIRRPGWNNPFAGLVDHLVDGPGEAALLNILGIEAAGEKPPVPHYGALPLADYLSPGLILPYSSSSGCYWSRCAFCPEKAEGSSYVPILPGRALEDLNELAGNTRPALIHFLDNAVSPSLMKAMVDRPVGVPWYGFARITYHLADPDFCEALRKSGCVMLKLGLESGDQGVLDRAQKGIDLKMASRALKTLKEAGIATYVYLLFGTPWETLAEARKTLEFTVRHMDKITFLNLAIFNMPAYGPGTHDLQTREHYQGDLSLYVDFDHPRGWERKLVRLFIDREFKRHKAIAEILRRDPPFFTCNHAPFFCGQEFSTRRW